MECLLPKGKPLSGQRGNWCHAPDVFGILGLSLSPGGRTREECRSSSAARPGVAAGLLPSESVIPNSARRRPLGGLPELAGRAGRPTGVPIPAHYSRSGAFRGGRGGKMARPRDSRMNRTNLRAVERRLEGFRCGRGPLAFETALLNFKRRDVFGRVLYHLATSRDFLVQLFYRR